MSHTNTSTSLGNMFGDWMKKNKLVQCQSIIRWATKLGLVSLFTIQVVKCKMFNDSKVDYLICT